MERVTDIIKKWKQEAGLGENEVVLTNPYPNISDIITIYTSKPGCFIGKEGKLYKKYFDIIKEKFGATDIKFEETDSWYIR